ncbi:MAG: hypothetical protein CMO61_04210 [Verrucomicrobiales bacterium]|nr:hypothetical protein [Verrucomicrobiales bacterium]
MRISTYASDFDISYFSRGGGADKSRLWFLHRNKHNFNMEQVDQIMRDHDHSNSPTKPIKPIGFMIETTGPFSF